MYKYVFIFLTTLSVSFSHLSAQNFDAKLLHNINQQSCMHGFSTVISESTLYLAAGIPVAMGITALATQNDALFKETLCYGVSLGLSIGLSYGLKYIVNRPRPYITHPGYINNLATEGSPSFPSTHTTIAFSVATSLTLMYPKWYVAVPSYMWAASVGYSRMNIGVHYPSDVLTGALLGAGSAYLTYELNKLLWKKTNNKPLIGLKAYQE